MLFNSFPFIFGFLPVALAGCFLLARFFGPAAAHLWLIAASLTFYAFWNVIYLPLLLGSIVFNYAMVAAMLRQKSPDHRRWLLIGAVVADLLLLGYYKYTLFLLDVVNSLFGTDLQTGAILLPLGISFYTFQQLTLLADISSGESHRVRFRDFILFVTFFPHLIAGPIVHHHEMMPQFQSAKYRFDWQNMAVGISLFAVGLFKKAVLADGIAASVSPLYADVAAGHPPTLIYSWMAAIGFTLQLYFDFSGYSEMALGLARMVGIKLPMNFNSPLKATSIIEFWSRWHLTLTRFLTAYLYNPMAMAVTRRRLQQGKKAVMGTRTPLSAFVSIVALPTIATMTLAGLWHGAGYQWLVFGLLHGSYLVINHAWRILRPRFWTNKQSYERIWTPAGFLLTFCAVAVGMVFARADSLSSAMSLVGGMLGVHGVALPDAIAHRLPAIGQLATAVGIVFIPASISILIKLTAWISVLLLIALVPPNMLEIMREYEPAVNLPKVTNQLRIDILPRWRDLLVWRGTHAWAASLALVTAADILALNQVSEFLYWQF